MNSSTVDDARTGWSWRRTLTNLAFVGAACVPFAPANAQTPQTDPVRWTLGAEPMLSISEFTSASGGDVTLFEVADVTLLPGGGLAIANGSEAVLYAFDADDQPVWQSAGSGKGPGEFASISWIQSIGDRLAAYDPVLQRLSWFDASTGALWRDSTFQAPTAAGRAPPEPIGILAGGSIATGSRLFPSGPVEGLFRPDVVLERVADGGAVRDSLAVFPGDELLIVRGIVAIPPYQRLTKFAVFDDQVAVTTGELLGVEVLSAEGPRRSYVDETWTPATGESIASYDVITRDTYPGVVAVEYDDAGRLWLSSPMSMEGGELSYRWSILDSDLQLVGSLTVAGDMRILSILGDRAAVVRKDPLDIEYVEVYSLDPTGSGGTGR